MRAKVTIAMGFFLALLGSMALANEPVVESPAVRLGLPAGNASVVRAQDVEQSPDVSPPIMPMPTDGPPIMTLPTLGRPMKLNRDNVEQLTVAPTPNADVVTTHFMMPQAPKQEPPPAPVEAPKPPPPGVQELRQMPQTSGPSGPVMMRPAPWEARTIADGHLGTGCYDCGACCGEQLGHVYASAEYLLWWFRDHHTPELVTGGTITSGGILGLEGTVVLYGGDVNTEEKHGGRFTIGYWCDECRTLGVEATLFALAKDEDGFEAFSAGNPILARPFFNVFEGEVPGTIPPVILTPGEEAELVAFPNELAGGINVRLTSKMWGAEVNARKQALCGTGPHCITYTVDALAGPRYVRFEEDLTIDENLVTLATDTLIPLGTNIQVIDRFRTRNQFMGGQVGALAEFRRGPFFLDVRAKLGLGVNRQTVNIEGVTIFRLQDGSVAAGTGGLLAQPTNIGRHRNNEFSILPELNGTVGYQVSENLRVFAGYGILYWTNVVRPGDQIDRGLNLTQRPTLAGPGTLVGPARPLFSFNQRNFWAHGVNLGVEFRY